MFKMNSHPGKQASARAQAGHKKRANTQGAPPHPMNAHESAPPADDELRILTEDELATAMPSEVIRQKEIENVLAKRRENRERDGELVEALGERLRAQALAQEVRDKILDVPGQIAALLAAESDELKVHSMMTDALIAALERLADGNTERV